MGAGWDINTTFAFWSLVVGVAGLLSAALALLPGWADYRDWLRDDTAYREKTVATLRDRRWAEGYRGWLKAGLDWLERRFGEAHSARALGVCTVISLCYAWSAFFIGYGMGAPGRLGEIELLPEALGPADRWAVVVFAIVLPAAAFFFGRWLGRWANRAERHLKVRLLQRRRQQALPLQLRAFERWYYIIIAIFTFLLVIAGLGLALLIGNNQKTLVIFGLGMLVATGPVIGLAIAKRVSSHWAKAPAAGLVGAAVVALSAAIAGGGAGAVAGAGALAFAAAISLAGMIAVAGATVGTIAAALAIDLAGAQTLANAHASAGALAIAVARVGVTVLAGAIGTAGAVGAAMAGHRFRQNHQGVFAGGVGVMLMVALLIGGYEGDVDDTFTILVLTFFLLLPLANGLWDWLSWRISRWLGRDLLARFDRDGQGWTITWHALADFVFALVFLATLAFALAFAVESYNQFALWRSGNSVYDLRAFVGEAAANPWTEGFWLTAMLLSTLVPTFLHFALLLASPLVMLVAGNPKRAALAAALDGYDAAGEQDAILQRVGWHLARSQYLAWAGALLLTILLLVLFGTFIGLIHEGGLAAYVADIAMIAIDVAEWCFGGT